ncbi:hypothetical protein MF672_039110 [Actinomadura sp. ATCC 31491]|uniref:SseB family protein n=1 Tax=Actinomadura luzonensis TaxID=2805427 RepID=A0ABT0G6D7_9ACTN|nr:hypothetical protein [Actinomadura luzonensis]MCK2219765.1 hypothetical protein [Actinomadura luzonensis]
MTSIIPDQPAPSERALSTIEAHVDGLKRIAAFLRTTPDLPYLDALTVHDSGSVSLFLVHSKDARETITTWMLHAIDAGALVEPYEEHGLGGVTLYFGAAPMQVYTHAAYVSDLVVVTTETHKLTIEIPEHARREQPAGGAR